MIATPHCDRLHRINVGISSSLKLLLAALLVGVITLPACAQDAAQSRYYLIGNSLTWDTVPPLLSGDTQWHVDCGVSLQVIHTKTEKPCIQNSTVWTTALKEKQYDVVSVQPHYGTTLAQDVAVISEWMTLQPKAVFVIHSGWAYQAQRASEFASYAVPEQMTHNPGYIRALIAELRKLHPGRELRQTLAQNLLAVIADDIAANRAPLKDVAELYRDAIHVTHDAGKYLMHNAMRRALGQAPSAVGFEKVAPEMKTYLDSVLAQLVVTPADKALLSQLLSADESVNRAAFIEKISDADLKAKVSALLPQIQSAVKARPSTLALEAEIKELGGRLVCTPTAPHWLYLATGDRKSTRLNSSHIPLSRMPSSA